MVELPGLERPAQGLGQIEHLHIAALTLAEQDPDPGRGQLRAQGPMLSREPARAGPDRSVPAGMMKILDYLADQRVLHVADGRYHWMADTYPAEDVSLRRSIPVVRRQTLSTISKYRSTATVSSGKYSFIRARKRSGPATFPRRWWRFITPRPCWPTQPSTAAWAPATGFC